MQSIENIDIIYQNSTSFNLLFDDKIFENVKERVDMKKNKRIYLKRIVIFMLTVSILFSSFSIEIKAEAKGTIKYDMMRMG